MLLYPGVGGAAPPPAVSEAIRVGGLARPMEATLSGYDFGSSGGGDGGVGVIDGVGGEAGVRGFGATVRRALALAKSREEGPGGSSDGSKKDKKDKDKDKLKDVAALVIGGNFTLNGKSTNVAQYDPIRWACKGEG